MEKAKIYPPPSPLFGVPYRCTDGGEIWRVGRSRPLIHSSMPNFTPWVIVSPLRAINLKIALWLTYISALCAARNAAGKNTELLAADNVRSPRPTSMVLGLVVK